MTLRWNQERPDPSELDDEPNPYISEETRTQVDETIKQAMLARRAQEAADVVSSHRWLPDAEHGSRCSRCDVPSNSRAATQPCGGAS